MVESTYCPHSGPGGAIPFISAPEYASSAEDAIWIIKDLLPQGGKLSLTAPAKRGKTYLALQIAGAIADPRQTLFLDFPVHQHGPVLFLELDTASGLFKLNYVRKLLEQKVDLSNVWIADRMMPDVPSPFIISGTGGTWLRQECNRLKPIAVIIDTVRNIHLGDENKAEVMQGVVEATMAAIAPAAAIWLAHPRKLSETQTSDIVDDTRGSSAFNASVDIIARLSKTRFAVKGRTERQEDDYAKVTRDDDGFWILAEDKNEKYRIISDIIESMPEGYKKKELIDKICEVQKISPATAKRRLKEMQALS